MVQDYETSEGAKPERRKRWRDRRVIPDRRNPDRLQRTGYDCRSGAPRRESDIGGELVDGALWWEEGSETI